MTSRRIVAALWLGCVFIALAPVTSSQDVAAPGRAGSSAPQVTAAALGKLPLYFVENRGVHPEAVRYYIQGADKTLFFTDRGITIALKGTERGWTVKLDFVGASEHARPVGFEKQQAVFSYFTGAEKGWRTGLPTYAKAIYRDLWPGIDLVYNGTINKLKYEFVVAPGADPRRIRLRYRGATEVTATGAGALRVATPEGAFEDAPPEAWQEIGGRRVPVDMAYALGEDDRFGFTIGDYDCTKPLILDPAVIVYCGYIGGAGNDPSMAVALDASGQAYVVGSTTSGAASFPDAVGPSRAYSGATDAFIAKVNARGTALIYCGYIGGSMPDVAFGVAVDTAGRAYVTGTTQSNFRGHGFPVKGGPSISHGGSEDAFVARVNAAGTALDYCGYIGGAGVDKGFDVAVDSKGSAYVGGLTASDQSSFPEKTGPYLVYRGGATDAFVAKVNPAGSALEYCGYLGGSALDHVTGVAVDAAGCVYVNGYTDSTDLHVKTGPDLTHNGGVERFVGKIDASGKSLVYCGYVGGKGRDSEYGSRPRIAVDSRGCAYLTGETKATNLPVKNGPYLNHAGTAPLTNGWDAFVAKVNVLGTDFEYCGYIGGTHDDHGTGIALDGHGNAYVCGYTFSSEKNRFPVSVGPDTSFNAAPAGNDAFIAKIAAGGMSLVYCGYLGGSGQDFGHAVAATPSGEAIVVGYARGSTEKTFPVVTGPDLTYNGGADDAFVAKVSLLDGLTTSGIPRPGTTVPLNLSATEARGVPYQLGTALGVGPIRIGTRSLGLGVGPLLEISVGGRWPHVFRGYAGKIDSQGRAKASIALPNLPLLRGLRIHSAFVTLDPAWPFGIRSISQTRTITIQ